MRATINFEVDVERVQQIMWALAFQEMDPLHQAMDSVETAKPHELHAGLASALENIYGVARQLEQYKDMVASFEKARLETILPQEVPAGNPAHNLLQVKQAAEKMQQFDKFLGKIAEETTDDSEPQEG